MNRNHWLILGAIAAASAQAVACSSEFTSCADTRTCPGDGASGTGDTGGEKNGEAGEAETNGGRGGRSGNGGKAGAEDPFEAGAGGEGGYTEEPALPTFLGTLYGPCSVSGDFACADHASPERLACDGKKWQLGSNCTAGQLCDSTSGKCAVLVPDCADEQPGSIVCRGDAPLTCGPDLVSAKVGTECAGLCKDGACQPPICGDGKEQEGEECDDKAATASGACVSCKDAKCGDGAVYAAKEQCDDHNATAGDGCSSSCTWEPIAVVAGTNTTCALSVNGKVKCWGDNAAGQLGLGDTTSRGDGPNEMGSNLANVALGTNRLAKALSSKSGSTCALLDDNSLKCWGVNDFGQLGTGDKANRGSLPQHMGDALLPITLGAQGPSALATTFSMGGWHACAIVDGGATKCWGRGGAGILGQGTATEYLQPASIPAIKLSGTAKAVSATSDGATCLLLDGGTVKCWGANLSGIASVSDSYVGDTAADMAGLKALQFGSNHTVKAISLGEGYACAVLDDDTLKCWGGYSGGRLGQGFGESDYTIGSLPETLSALPVVNVGVGRKVQAVSAGPQHVCSLLNGGTVKCWGSNIGGQLGQGTINDLGDGPNEMGDALKDVALGNGRTARQVSAGYDHTCALLDNGTVKCWGNNDKGQLGLGDTAARGKAAGQMGDALPAVDLKF